MNSRQTDTTSRAGATSTGRSTPTLRRRPPRSTSTPRLRSATSITGCAYDVIHTFEMGPGASFGVHRHDAHQLVWSMEGLLRVQTRDQVWVVGPTRALWLPAEVDHDVFAIGAATMRTLYLHGDGVAPTSVDPSLIEVDELLRGVIDRLARTDLTAVQRRNLEQVLFDCVQAEPSSQTRIVLPRDERARHVAVGVLDNPRDVRTLAEWARSAGASTRTLSRLFAAETGSSFEQWRRETRMHVARGLLAEGMSVERCAQRVGYRSASSFGVAYRSTYGRTPSATPPIGG